MLLRSHAGQGRGHEPDHCEQGWPQDHRGGAHQAIRRRRHQGHPDYLLDTYIDILGWRRSPQVARRAAVRAVPRSILGSGTPRHEICKLKERCVATILK